MSPKKTLEEINRRFLEVPRRSMIHLLGLTVLVLALPTIARAQDRPPIFQQMFKAYGFESFGQVEKIRYTFNLEAPGLNLSRSWEWEPKTDLISYEGKGNDGKPVKVTYSRSQLGSQSDLVRKVVTRPATPGSFTSAPTIELRNLSIMGVAREPKKGQSC